MSEADVAAEPAPEAHGGSQQVIALSVEQTNALRARLGLRPLDEGGSGDDKSARDREAADRGRALMEEAQRSKKSKEIVARIAESRETRRLESKLRVVKTLGETSDGERDLDDAALWVTRSRERERQAAEALEKAAAQHRARELDELDASMGGGGAPAGVSYTSDDLRGLRVEHSVQELQAGSEVILTLKDEGVLSEGEGEVHDVLVNPSLVDTEAARRNVERRKLTGRKVYSGADDEQFADGAVPGTAPKQPRLLGKYDEVIDGEEKAFFVLGGRRKRPRKEEAQPAAPAQPAPDGGAAGGPGPEQRGEAVRKAETKQAVSLDIARAVVDDFLTQDELAAATFRRKGGESKKRKIRKRDRGEAADVASDTGAPENHAGPAAESLFRPVTAAEAADVRGIEVDDLADEDLQRALAQSRRARNESQPRAEGPAAAARLVAISQAASGGDASAMEDAGEGDSALVFSQTDEFVRSLTGSTSAAGRMRGEGGLGDRVETTRAGAGGITVKIESTGAGAMDVDVGGGLPQPVGADAQESKVTDADVFGTEAPVRVGLAAALDFAKRRGFLEADTSARRTGEVVKVSSGSDKAKERGAADRESRAIDKKFDDERIARERALEREREYRRDWDRNRHGYPTSASTPAPASDGGKPEYKPEVELVYTDALGHVLTPKEAFKQQSWKFHGQLPSKRKQEKYIKKILNEQKARETLNAQSGGHLTALEEEKKREGKAFVVLSGSGAGSSTSVTLLKKP